MDRCHECGQKLKLKDVDEAFSFHDDDEEIKVKDGLLAELMEELEGTLGSRLSSKKPVAMSVQMVTKKKDEEEEEEDY